MNRETARKIYKLTTEQKTELQRRYYAGEKTNILIEEFKLHGLKRIYYLFDNFVTDTLCEYCNVNMEREPNSRSSAANNTVCPKCNHTIHPPSYRQCNCKNCHLKKLAHEQLQNKSICKFLSEERKKERYPFEKLTDREKILLGSLVTFAMNEDLEYVQPLKNCSRLFLPCFEKSNQVLIELHKYGIIILSNRYHAEAFQINNEYEVTSFDYEKVFFEIWSDNFENCMKLLNPERFLEDEQIITFWRCLNHMEAIKYFLNVLQKIRIPKFSPGKKTNELFSEMSEKFSLSQIFRIINYITDKTAKDILVGEKYRLHAANATITRMESYYKRALYENYSLHHVTIPKDLSMVTTYFYNKILNMGDSAFYSVPDTNLKV